MNDWKKFFPSLCLAALLSSCQEGARHPDNPFQKQNQDRDNSETLVAICAVKFTDNFAVRNPETYAFAYDKKSRKPLGQIGDELTSIAEEQAHYAKSGIDTEKIRTAEDGQNITKTYAGAGGFLSMTFNTNTLTLTRHTGEGSTYQEAFTNRTVSGTGKCEILKLPFKTKDKNHKSFATYLEKNTDWGTSIEGKVLSIGKCKEEVSVDYAYRSMTCREGFIQKTSPMGTQVCKLHFASTKVETAKIKGRTETNKTKTIEPSLNLELGECRWKT